MINLIGKYRGVDNFFKFCPANDCFEAETFFDIIILTSVDYDGIKFFDGCFIIKKAIQLWLSFNISIEKKYIVRLANFLESCGIELRSPFSKVFFNQ